MGKSYFKDLIAHLLSSRTARLKLSLFGGSLLNLLYLAGNAASALLYNSVWSATVTVYHLMLIIIRVYLLSEGKIDRAGQSINRICLRVGILLLFLDITSAYMMIYTIERGSFVRYSGIFFFGFLVYTLYSVINSVYSMKKHANDKKRIHFVAKSIRLSTSLMSIFNLQYSFFAFLGASGEPVERAILIGGALVFTIILSISVMLLRRGLSGLFSSKI